MKQGKACGYGTIYFDTQGDKTKVRSALGWVKYNGMFEAGLMHGTGTLQFHDGRVFQGEFVYGKMKKGLMTDSHSISKMHSYNDYLKQDITPSDQRPQNIEPLSY